jgi:hypothetical protein
MESSKGEMMYMQNYELQWLFHLKYNRKLKQASIKSSKHFQETEKLEKELVLDDEMIKQFLHKYDYRKFIYFSSKQIKGTFDTLLRFKIKDQKQYLRTHAVCVTTKDGFECLHFTELDVVKLTREIIKTGVYPLPSVMRIVDIDLIKELTSASYLQQISKQIIDLVDREIKQV